MNTWPYPGDAPIAIARRVALAYRGELERADPDACRRLDERMRGWGQPWVAPRAVTADLDDLIPAADAADLAAVTAAQLRVWRLRGRLAGTRIDGKWWYRVRDVHQLATATRRRRQPGKG